MRNYKKINNEISNAPIEEDNDKIDLYSMDVAVERIEGGLVGTLRIDDDMNSPLFKKNDLVSMMHPARVQIKDFVLYKSHENYFLRRIIKFKGDDIFVAGDNEKGFHIIKREDIIGKVVSRQRGIKRLSFSLTPKKKLYTFKKVNLSFLRLKNRVIEYEQEINDESLELAASALEQTLPEFQNTTEIKYNIDLDSDLQSFLNPDQLVLELRKAGSGEANDNTDLDEEEEKEDLESDVLDEDEDAEVVQYVDEDGNIIENIDEINASTEESIDESADSKNELDEAINSQNEDASEEDATPDEEEVKEEWLRALLGPFYLPKK